MTILLASLLVVSAKTKWPSIFIEELIRESQLIVMVKPSADPWRPRLTAVVSDRTSPGKAIPKIGTTFSLRPIRPTSEPNGMERPLIKGVTTDSVLFLIYKQGSWEFADTMRGLIHIEADLVRCHAGTLMFSDLRKPEDVLTVGTGLMFRRRQLFTTATRIKVDRVTRAIGLLSRSTLGKE